MVQFSAGSARLLLGLRLRFEESCRVQKGPVESPDPVSHFPWSSALGFLSLKLGAHEMHLGVKIIKKVEQHGFGDHGHLGRTELKPAMVAQNHVFHQEPE